MKLYLDGPNRSNEDELTPPLKSVRIIQKPNTTTTDINHINHNQHICTTTTTPSANSSALLTPISSDIFLSNSSAGSDGNSLPIIDKVLRLSSLTNKGLLISTLISNNNHLSDCVALNHHKSSIRPPTADCARCRYIEDELLKDFSNSLANDLQKPGDNGEQVHYRNEPTVLNVSSVQKEECLSNIESVWQVDDGKTVNISEKQSSPKTEVVLEENSSKAEIDSTSFIILRDDDDDGAGTTNRTSTKSATEEEMRKNSSGIILNRPSRGQCDDCCYCNPSLHQNDGSSNERACNYCKSAKPGDTPLAEDAHRNGVEHKSTTGTNTALQPETGTVYEEKLTTKDHTHVRTKSKDSDTVSLKCTKINSKIRRIIPENDVSIEILSNMHRKKKDATKQRQRAKPMTSNSGGWNNRGREREETTGKGQTESKLSEKDNPAKSTRCNRRSRPFDIISSQSYDSSHHCSSSSSSPTSPKREIVLPAAGRMRSNSMFHGRKLANERTSRYQDFYANNGDKQNNNNLTDVIATEQKRVNENSVIPATINHNQSK